MHFAARAFVLAIVPSIASAQTESRSFSPATPQATPSFGRSAAVAEQRPDSVPPGLTQPRVLVLECPSAPEPSAIGASLARERIDTAGTARLVAQLCARAVAARGNGATSEGAADASAAASPAHSRASHPETRQAGAVRVSGDDMEPTEPQRPVVPQLQVHLFADVRYSATDSTGSKNGFGLGQFDLFARSELSDNFSVLSEATLTALPRNTFNAKIERLLLSYSPSNHFTASVGRFHTGIGYYNAAYHHGAWFQTATGRPIVFGIDGDIGVVPIHTLGITATGEIPSGALGLHYISEIGSGRASQSSAAVSPQPGLNDNNTPSFNVGLFARPDRFDGLQVGVSVYRDRLTLSDTSKKAIDETITAAHALYKTDAVELLSEAVLIRHRSRSGLPATNLQGYYAQASRRFGVVRPYVRVDYVDVPRADQLFGFLGRRSGPTLGIRYDFDALAALKVQTSHLSQTTRSTMNRFDAQVSFMF
jgi:hypothetical protein